MADIKNGTPLRKFEEVFSSPYDVKVIYDGEKPAVIDGQTLKRYRFNGVEVGLFAIYSDADLSTLRGLAIFPQGHLQKSERELYCTIPL